MIEIIAIGNGKIYSVGKINISKQGDIYIIKNIENIGLHFSRHKSGECHIRTKEKKLSSNFEKRETVDKFDGIEFLETWCFGIESFHGIYKEYKPKKCNNIVAINMSCFKKQPFNLGIWLLTEKGIPELMNMWKNFTNRQVYICTHSQLLVGFIWGAFKK